MILNFAPYDLTLQYPFRISNFSRTATPIVLTQIKFGDTIGYGEASLPPYLGETTESVCKFFKQINDLNIFEKYLNINLNKSNIKNNNAQNIDIHVFMSIIDDIADGHTAAKAAIDIALHDLKGKLMGQPVWELLGSQPSKMVETSYTIGIETDPSVLKQKIQNSDKFNILKIKLGTDDDKKLIQNIRHLTQKPLYIDANQGWTDVDFAIEMTHWLTEQGAILIEQPMPKTDLNGNARVTEQSPIPVFADESFQRLRDFDKIQGVFHGINIKLMKSTGLCEASNMVAEARKRQLKVMIGCMSETSCAILAAAALAPQCDFVDLDTPWLVSNNPFEAPILRGGIIQLSTQSGLGLEHRKSI